MNAKTNTMNNRAIAPALAAQYRRDPPTINDSVAGLNGFLTHRAILHAGGDQGQAEIAERAWWQDALLLAAMPAWSAAEAHGKVVALLPALDGCATNRAGDGHRGLITMIAAGVAMERSRWGIPTGVDASPTDCSGWRERTMNNVSLAIIGVAPWQLALYDAMRRPRSLHDTIRSVLRFAAHQAVLQDDGDEGAATGAAYHVRLALIEVASIEVASLPALFQKAQTLGAHRAVWAGDALATAMVTAAIAADAAALKPRSREAARLERLLQGAVR